MIDDQDERIVKILGIEELEDLDNEALNINDQTLEKHFKYLRENIEYPCHLIGPLYTREKNIFNLVNFHDIDPYDGIIVTVERLSNKENITLPLSDLKVREKSQNYQLIDDYSFWFGNYRNSVVPDFWVTSRENNLNQRVNK